MRKTKSYLHAMKFAASLRFKFLKKKRQQTQLLYEENQRKINQVVRNNTPKRIYMDKMTFYWMQKQGKIKPEELQKKNIHRQLHIQKRKK